MTLYGNFSADAVVEAANLAAASYAGGVPRSPWYALSGADIGFPNSIIDFDAPKTGTMPGTTFFTAASLLHSIVALRRFTGMAIN